MLSINKLSFYFGSRVLYDEVSLHVKVKDKIGLIGANGTGKSTFLRYIAKNTTKNYIIVAPTGIAAINAGGMTINSFFQLPFPVPGRRV